MQRTPSGETHVVSRRHHRSAGQINWSAIVVADSSCCRLESVPWETFQTGIRLTKRERVVGRRKKISNDKKERGKYYQMTTIVRR